MKLAASLAVFVGLLVPSTALSEPRPTVVQSCPDHVEGLSFYKSRYVHWTQQHGARTLYSTARKPRNCNNAAWLADVWRRRAQKARRSYERHLARVRWERRALYAKWECIHSKEGAWNANTGNGYYGGLQMDITFQKSHGWKLYVRWGTANNWPVWAQLEAAEDAYRTRGFHPWPNTARECGLL